jgi:uncharacterized repeat protein (TIGR03806 family)
MKPLAFALLLLATTSHAALLHRWSFNAPPANTPSGTTFTDSLSSTPLTVRGLGATLDGTRIILPGTTTSGTQESQIAAYLNLPNGLISSKTHLTVEVWAAPLSARFFQPLFDFGRMNHPGDGAGAPGEWTGTTPAWPPTSETSDGIALLFNRFTDLNTQRQGSRLNNANPVYLDSNLPTTAGTTYHYVFTFTDTPAGGTVAWYRNASLVGSTNVDFHLSDIEDVNNWFGRSQWNILSNAHAAYSEIRLYDQALSPSEITASRDAGPDTLLPPPVLQPDAATLHHLQKIRLPVLANDAPGTYPATIEIVTPPLHGTATPDPAGRILYHHTTGTPVSDSFTYRVNSASGFSTPVSVTLTFATSLRLPNTSLNVPSSPPPTTISHEPAFPSLTFAQPVAIASVPGDTQRLFIVERMNGIRVIPNVTAQPPTSSVFLNLAALLAARGESISNTYDQGLLSLAFHPQHLLNRQFFIFYSVRIGSQEFFRISRFNTLLGQPNVADPASELILIQQLDPNGYHLGSDMHFGTDGFLYIALGDGGGQNDSRQVSQRINQDFFSAMLRIDVDKTPGNPEPNPHPSVPTDAGIARYSIPATNPFYTTNPTVTFNGASLPANSVRTEFFAVGLRSPWRFSIDPPTGEIWLADVGQITFEEINLITLGGNYGWSFREGTANGPQNWRAPVGFTSIPPLYQYGNPTPGSYNRSVTGGLVYRGTRIPSLTGAYLFADYLTGDISSLTRNGPDVSVQRVTGASNIVAFGADPSNQDLLMADIATGIIRRLVQGSDDTAFPATLSATGLFADLTDLSPAPGLLPYTPNLSFWSDHAIKRRWFIIPNDADLTWIRNGPWSYPDGMIWVKHFDLELTRGNPATSRRIETRLLVKNATGSYGVSYRWNDAQTDATLVPDAGLDLPLDIIENGSPRVQNYRIPSRSQCLSCHNPQAGHALSFDTPQLNRHATIHGHSGNQLQLLHTSGYFTNTPDSPNLLPRHVRPDETAFSLEARARSYLAVNCASCHAATGGWDARLHRTLAQTGTLNTPAINNGGNPANRLIVPGSPSHSIILSRIAASNGFTRMPPLGSNELDQPGITLLTDWINQLASRQTYDQWRTVHFGSDPSGDPLLDPDNDGLTNQAEFLAGSLPLTSASAFTLQSSTANGLATFDFTLPPNRTFQIETSTNLLDWHLWDIPGNNGLPSASTTTQFSTPLTPPNRFFRLQINEP